ncbi:MAG: hypothetical protein M3Q96_01790, partial [Pseudomonadota bacterium]|nr:hypothetical protein [Pseudomonadota bacterium]MDQ3140106.1 hypothetical protein [Pseudomonadota bacterium]
VQRGRRKVRAVSLNQYSEGQYVAPDQSALSEHVTESGIVSMAYQAEPGSMLFGVRADGQMAVLTCERDQDVFGWTRQLTQGSFENVEVVPTQDGASVFAVVSRTVNGATTRHIEMLDANMYVDAGITGSTGTAAATWGGLLHLRGMTVQAKGDGVYLGEFVVSDTGQVTLPRTAFTVEIGLAFTTTVKTLTPEFMGPAGSSQGHQLSITEARVRLLDTTGCAVNLQTIPFRALGLGVLDKPPPLFTGVKKAENLGWGDGIAQTLIQQVLPYPFHLLSVVTKLAANEG